MDRLLMLAKKGHKKAFKKLYTHYGNCFFGYVIKLIHSEAVARDIFEMTWQTIFLEIQQVESMDVSLFRTLNSIMAKEQTQLEKHPKNGFIISNHSLIIGLHLNKKMLQLTDSDLDFLLDQTLKSEKELKAEKNNTDIEIKLNRILSGLLASSQEYFQNITELNQYLRNMFKYHEIDQLMTYEIFLFIDNKQKRNMILFVGLFVILLISAFYFGRGLSPTLEDEAVETPTYTQEVYEFPAYCELNLIETSLNGSLVEFKFQLSNIDNMPLEYVDLVIQFPRISKRSYRLKRVNDIFTLYYDLNYEELLYDTLIIEATVRNAGELIIEQLFSVELSDLLGWDEVHPINKTIDTPEIQFQLINYAFRGPLLTVDIKELSCIVTQDHYLDFIVVDNNDNMYHGDVEELFDDGTYRLHFGNVAHYLELDSFELILRSIFYDDIESLGKIENEQKFFSYNNLDFTFLINRSIEGYDIFELISDDILPVEQFPELAIEGITGIYTLRPNGISDDTNITRHNYEEVYEKTGGNVTAEEMIVYYEDTYNIILNKDDLINKLYMLPDREVIIVEIDGSKRNSLTYQSYFGDALDDLELFIFNESIKLEINKSTFIECVE